MMSSPSTIQSSLGLPHGLVPSNPAGGLVARSLSSPSWRHEISSYGVALAKETFKTLALIPVSVPLGPLFFTSIPDTNLSPLGDAIGYAGKYLFNSAVVFGYSLASPFLAAHELWQYGAAALPGTDGALESLVSPEIPRTHKERLTERLFRSDYGFMSDTQKRRLWETVLEKSGTEAGRSGHAYHVYSHRKELKEKFPDLLQAFKEIYPGYRNHPEF